MTEEIANLLIRGIGRQRRRRGDRSDAHLHDDPRRPQAGQHLRHVGDEGPVPLEPLEPVGSDDADLRRSALDGSWRFCRSFSCAGVRLGRRHGDHLAAEGFERLLSQPSLRDAWD